MNPLIFNGYHGFSYTHRGILPSKFIYHSPWGLAVALVKQCHPPNQDQRCYAADSESLSLTDSKGVDHEPFSMLHLKPNERAGCLTAHSNRRDEDSFSTASALPRPESERTAAPPLRRDGIMPLAYSYPSIIRPHQSYQHDAGSA